MTNSWNTKKGAVVRGPACGGAVLWCLYATLLTLTAVAFVSPAQAQNATGEPAIVGEPIIGVTLTLDFSGIMDPDGVPAPADVHPDGILWFHTDDLNAEIGSGLTLTLIRSRDVGKNLYVEVEFHDNRGGKESVVLASWPATGTIMTPPELTLSVAPTTIDENGGTATVTLTTSDGNAVTVDQPVSLTLGGTATEGTDYTIGPKSLTLASGESSVTTTITATMDAESDDNETIRIAASSGGDVTGSPQTVTIMEPAPTPTLSVSLSAATIAEAAGTSTVTVTASGTTFSTDQTINLALAGTATKTADYTISAEMLTLTAGATAVTATVTAVQDNIDELDETVLITASHGVSTIGTQQTVTINDDDAAPTLSFTVSPAAIAEAAGASTVTVTASGTTFSTAQTIALALSGTATKGDDYTISPDSLTLTAGETSVMATVTAVQDRIDDDAETVVITASHNSVTIGTPQTVTINDDDAAPTLTVGVSPTAIAEAVGSSTVTVSTGGTTFATDQTIALALAGTATQTDDYTISADSLTLPAGATSVTATVTAVQDTIVEVDETVLITASVGGSTIGTQQTVTITDDDDAPTLTVSVSPAAIAEAVGSSTVTVSTGGTTFSTDQTINLALAGTATQTDDYTISAEMLTLPAGATSVTATVTAVQDTIVEVDETVLITASVGGSTIGTQQTVTITDDDDAPTLTVSVSPAAIAEAAGTSTLTVTATGTTFATDQTIALALSGTATKGDDYTISADSLTLPAGAPSVTATVTAVQDRIDDDAETVVITASHNSVTFGTQQTVTINDDDDAPTLTVGVSPTAIAEAVGSSTVTVSTGGTTFATDQTIALALSGTATKGDDYTISDDSLTLPAGAPSVTATVTAVQDRIDDDAETVVITASHNSVTIGTPQTVTITDDDDAPTLTVGVSPTAIAEAVGSSTVTVSTGGTTFATDQTIALALSGTATKGDDYTISDDSLTLPAGAPSVTATVTAVQDRIDDDAETVVITASHNSVTFGTPQTVTITDDDDAPTLTVGVSPAAIAEAVGSSTVTVSTGGTTFTTDQTIGLALSGTATKGDDYTISAESLTLTAGATSVTATVTAVDDLLDDDAETVLITASHNSINIGTQQTVTITDDDNTRIVSIAGTDANEPAGNMVFTISVSETSPGPVSVAWAAAAGEGDSAELEDFTASSGTATIVASQTSTTVSVPIVNDRIHEAAETIRVTLGAVSATGVTVALGPADSDRFAEASILNDDPLPSPTISVDDASIAEATGQAIVTIGTGSGSTFEETREYTLTLSGAGTDNDYTIGQTTLTLSAGVGDSPSQVSTTLTAIQDRIDEPNEAVVLTADFGSVTVTISDDDDAPVPTFTVDEASIDEAAGSATLTVSTGTGSTFEQAQTIVLSLAALGTATEADDFNIQSKTLTLRAGMGIAPSSITTTVTAVQDKIDEPNETILIDAKRGTGGSAPAVGSQLTVTVTDDDAEPVLTFTTNNDSIAEEAGSATLTVSTGSGSTFEQEQTIVLSLAALGTATEVNDFTILSKTLTLPAGVSTAASSVDTTVTAEQDKIDEPDETILIDAAIGGDTVGSQLTVTVADDDEAPVLSLVVSEATLDEAGGTSIVTVSTGTGPRDSTFETDQVLTLTLGGTATVNDDYTIGATELTLTAGVGLNASEITTLITAVDDDFFEGTTNEQLTVAGTRGGVAFGAARTVTIVENEEAPKLTLSLSNDSISEDGGTTTVTASVLPRTVDAFTVTFAVTPGAPATAADYDLAGELEFAALSATPTGTVTIETNNNRVDRPDKTVSVTGTSSQSYFLATDAVTLTIVDEDAPPAPVLEVSAADIAENGGESTVTVTTGDNGSTFPEAMTVVLTMTGAATENADYRIVSKSLTLPAGSGLDISMVSTTVTGIDDIIDDDAEDILIDAAIGGTAVGTQQGITITDDDVAPVPTLGVAPGSISENGGVSTVTVTTSTGTSTFATDQTITLTLSGTAVEDEDYRITSKTLTLPAGVGMNHALVTEAVTGLNDAIDETDRETVLIDAARATGPATSVAVGTQQTVEVEDDDGLPVLEFRASSTQIGENGGESTLTVTTGGGSTFEEEQTITLTVADGTAVEDSDYRVGPTSLTLPAGEGLDASVVTTTVTGLNDANYEGTADQTMTISAAHGAEAIGAPITIGVQDDESPSQTTLLLSRTTISEDSDRDNGASIISATVSPPSEVAFWVKTCWTGPVERMTWAARFGRGNCGYLEFRAGATSSVATTPSARFFGQDNQMADGDAVITISGEITGFDTSEFEELPNPLPGIRAPAPVTLTVEDDDSAATTVTLSVNTSQVDEDDGATVITVTGTLTGNTPSGATTVTLSVDSGAGESGALAGADFVPVEDFVLTIGAGATSATATFTLTPTDDTIDEPDETLTLSGSPGSSNVGMAGTVAITIGDNDAAPAPVLSVEPPSIAEDGGTSTVTVSTGTGSTFATDQTIVLTLTGTATQGGDYTIEATSLVLPAGAGSAASSVSTTITGVDDTGADPGETVIITGSVGGVDFDTARTITIADNEGSPTVTLLLTPEAVFEGGSSTVSARVSPVSAVAFDVTVSAAAVAPADAADFTLNGTTLSFAAGAAQSTGAVTIDATDDSEDSEDKTVTVSGTVSAAGVTAPADVALTIRDDEGAVTLSLEVSADSISEDGGTATVTVSTATDSTFDTDRTITLEIGGTATRGAGADYTIGSTALTLAAGTTSVSTTVTGLADDVFEGGETVTISTLLDGIGFGTARTITLTDGDTAPAVTLVLTPDSISENGGVSTVTATLSGPSEIPLDVTVSAEAVEPAVAADFELAGTTLSFAANATDSTGAVTVTGVDNVVDAPDKQVRIQGSVSDTRFTAPEVALLTLEDDDEASNTVTIAVEPAEVGEGSGSAELTVTATFAAGARETTSDFVISVLSGVGADAAQSGIDFADVSDFNLTIPANETTGTATFTLDLLPDIISEGPEVLSISASSANPDIGVAETPTVTLTDDDALPSPVLVVSPASMAESGGTATVTINTGTGSTYESVQTITLTLAGTATEGSDYVIGLTTLTLPAGSGEAASSITTSLSARDDIVDEAAETVEVSAAIGGTGIGTGSTSITDDDDAPVLVLTVNPATILENGGTATVTVSTGAGSTFAEEQTITLALAGTAALDDDYTLSSDALTLPAGEGFDASSVTAEIVAVDDTFAERDETVEIVGVLDGNSFSAAQPLTIADDEGEARVVLLLSTPSVSENGGVATLRALVSPAASESFTVIVTVAPGGTGNFVLTGPDGETGTDSVTFTFEADTTESSGEASITAVDNNRLDGDRVVTVSGAVSLDGVQAPPDVTLTILDDDAPPAVTLLLTPASIDENGGVSRVTAVLNTAVAEPFTVTVSAAAVEPAEAGDFILAGAGAVTLSFAADATESSGEVTITAVDNGEDAPDKTVTVSGTVSLDGVAAPAAVTLTIADDDEEVTEPPAVTLLLTPASIDENGGVSRVTASVSPASPVAFTVTVSAAAVEPAMAGDFVLAGAGGAGAVTLSFAADATESSGEVTITAVDNGEDAPDKTVTVTGTVSLDGVAGPAAVVLTIADDDEEVTEPPAVTLLLTPASIDENGGVSRVTATVSRASPEPFTVTVSAAAVEPAMAGDFVLAGPGGAETVTLSFAADATESSGEVTIMAVDNDEDAPDKTVTVSGTVSSDGVAGPAAVVLTIADDDEEVTEPPAVTLLLTPALIDENGGVGRVTASVSPASPEAFTVTVSAAAVEPAMAGDFVLAGAVGAEAVTLSFAAAATESSGEVTITAVDNDEDAPDRTVTVTGTVSLDGVAGPAAVTLTIADDDGEGVTEPPAVTLLLTPASINEKGGVSRVTATVSPASPEPFTVTVSAAAVEPAMAGDFVLAGTVGAEAVTLSFAAAATESSGEVTITAVDNDEDAPDRTVTVTGTVSLDGVAGPAAVTLTIADDDEGVTEPPAVTLLLTPALIDEDGGVSRVTASVSPASPEAFTVTVLAAVVEPAMAGDFVLAGAGGAGAVTLSFAAAATESSGEVTITAVDNDEDAPDKTVTITGTVSLAGVAGPAAVTLTIADDDEGITEPPAVTLLLTPALIDENGGVSRVRARVSPSSPEAFTVTVSAAAVEPAMAGDFVLAGPGGAGAVTLSFAAEATESSGEVTITAVDNDEDAPDKTVTITGTVSLAGVAGPAAVTLTIADDDEGITEPPAVTLLLTPALIDENGGVSRVRARVSPSSREPFTVMVSAAAVEPAMAGDFVLAGTGGAGAVTLSFAANATESSGEVTITAVDNGELAPDKTVTVTGTVSLDGVAGPAAVTLTIADDDGVEIAPTALTIADDDEAGSTYTVKLDVEPTADVTVTVSVPSGSGLTVSPATLTFTADNWQRAQTVTVTIAADAVDQIVMLTHTAAGGGYEDVTVADVSVRITGLVDPMPKAWIARFGRTVAEQVLDAVEARREAEPRPGAEASLAGQRIGGAGLPENGAGRQVADHSRSLSDWLMGETDPQRQNLGSRTITERELLTGSSFTLTAATEGSGLISVWGRGAVTRFTGGEGDLTVDGDVASGMLGADWTEGALKTGLLLSHSLGEGDYRGAGEGTVTSTLTGMFPWVHHALSERLSVWGVAGHGKGSLTLEPEEQASIRTDLDLWMAAAGLRGVLVDGGHDGLTLAAKTDAMIVRTSSDAVSGGSGSLAAEEAGVSRLRFGLDGSRPFRLAEEATLTPSVEIGVRHDGGDAETGFGVDIGGGLAWSDTWWGIAAEFRGGGLLTHAADGFRERGLSGSLSWDPQPASDRGPRVSFTQTLGGSAGGGMNALLSRDTLTGLAANDNGDDRQRRLETRFRYGFAAFGGRFTSLPEIAVGLSNAGRDYSLGWRLVRAAGAPGGGAFELSVEALRRESANDDIAPEHQVGFRVNVRY